MALTVQLVPAGVIMEVSVKQKDLKERRRFAFGTGDVSDCEKIGRKAPEAGERLFLFSELWRIGLSKGSNDQVPVKDRLEGRLEWRECRQKQ